MRRAIRRFLIASWCLLTLLLALGIGAMWTRSLSVADWWQCHETSEIANTWRAWDLVGGRSGIYVSKQLFVFERPGHALEYAQNLNRLNGFGHHTSGPQPNPYAGGSVWNRMGFGIVREPLHYDPFSSDRYQYSFEHGHVPYWFLLLVLFGAGSPPLVGLYRRRRQARRARSNRCIACGYDLRASPDRCPECGTVAAGLGANPPVPLPATHPSSPGSACS
jgi:hypothetical protein